MTLTLKEVKAEYIRRTMYLRVARLPWRTWDRLTPEQRQAAHEQYELICAQLDREKLE